MDTVKYVQNFCLNICSSKVTTNMFQFVTSRFDYSKLTYTEHVREDYQRIKHEKSTLNYLTYVWMTVKTAIKLLGPLILQWIDENHVDLKQKFIGNVSKTIETWDDLKQKQKWNDLQLLQEFLFNPSFVNNQFTFDLYKFVFKQRRGIQYNTNKTLNKVLNEGIFINIFNYLASIQEAACLARTCRLFYQYTFTKNFLCNISYTAILKLTDKQYRAVLQSNVDNDWYLFQLVKNYYNYSDCIQDTDAISQQHLKHYGGYRHHFHLTDVVCDKLSFIQIPKIKSHNILPIEWDSLRNRIRGKLKVLVIENDTNDLMVQEPYHASIICWYNSRLFTSCFAELGCYPDVKFWVVTDCFMLTHFEADPIKYGVSQVSNKKLYFFDDLGCQLWQIFVLSLHNVEVYNYCVNQLFIQTTWDNAVGMTFDILLDYLVKKNDKFGHCPIDINIFYFMLEMNNWLN